MFITIQKAKEKDLKDIKRLNFLLFKKEQIDYDSTLNINWPFQEGEKYFQERIGNKDALVLVAKMYGGVNNGEKVVGYLIGALKDVNASRIIKRRSILENMFVLSKFRNQKIGAKLVQKFIQWSKEKKVENVRVTAFAGNNLAIRFYEQHGFKKYNCTLEINLKS